MMVMVMVGVGRVSSELTCVESPISRREQVVECQVRRGTVLVRRQEEKKKKMEVDMGVVETLTDKHIREKKKYWKR